MNNISKNVKITSAVMKKRSYTIFGIITVVSFFLILCSTDAAIEYMKKGLRLCAGAVIPSLFPFMVMSELIVSSGVGVRISKLFAKPMRYLFGVSEAGAAAYLLGIVCGFPIGAKTAVSMYDRGTISKKELERLLTFCNNPGSAFVISAVGISLFGSKRVGIILYICVIFSSLLVGFFGKYFLGYKKEVPPSIPMAISEELSIKAVTGAVQSSAISMLTVCAYVVFFSAFVGCIGSLLSRFSLPDEILACIFGFFELSSGVGTAAEVADCSRAILLCAFFVGWSGLSVAFQIMSVSAGRNISFKPYFVAKAIQGLLCMLIMGVFTSSVGINTLLGKSSELNFFETLKTEYSFPLALFSVIASALILFVSAAVSDMRRSLIKSRKKLKKGIDKQDFV